MILGDDGNWAAPLQEDSCCRWCSESEQGPMTVVACLCGQGHPGSSREKGLVLWTLPKLNLFPVSSCQRTTAESVFL
jgi:hypothetical protein